ncbi:hypothetical protein BC830DRAFT_908138, partial [Chytriomyces sp. MP71]
MWCINDCERKERRNGKRGNGLRAVHASVHILVPQTALSRCAMSWVIVAFIAKVLVRDAVPRPVFSKLLRNRNLFVQSHPTAQIRLVNRLILEINLDAVAAQLQERRFHTILCPLHGDGLALRHMARPGAAPLSKRDAIRLEIQWCRGESGHVKRARVVLALMKQVVAVSNQLHEPDH